MPPGGLQISLYKGNAGKRWLDCRPQARDCRLRLVGMLPRQLDDLFQRRPQLIALHAGVDVCLPHAMRAENR